MITELLGGVPFGKRLMQTAQNIEAPGIPLLVGHRGVVVDAARMMLFAERQVILTEDVHLRRRTLGAHVTANSGRLVQIDIHRDLLPAGKAELPDGTNDDALIQALDGVKFAAVKPAMDIPPAL